MHLHSNSTLRPKLLILTKILILNNLTVIRNPIKHESSAACFRLNLDSAIPLRPLSLSSSFLFLPPQRQLMADFNFLAPLASCFPSVRSSAPTGARQTYTNIISASGTVQTISKIYIKKKVNFSQVTRKLRESYIL